MTQKDYYGLLELPPSASSEEIKRAFRSLIARYHPDKVQHLGREFQAMAADRAAELTEAYRILSDERRRAEYDRLREAAGPQAPAPVAAPSGTAPPPAAAPPPEPDAARERPPAGGGLFSQERAKRDVFVKKATLERLRHAFGSIAGEYEQSSARGFDIAWVPKGRFFGKAKGPRLLGRFVSHVDAEAVKNIWGAASSIEKLAGDESCVLLMGSSVAPARELADAIAEQRRRPSRGDRITIIPVDGRDWEAFMPTDAPPVARTLLTRLRSGG